MGRASQSWTLVLAGLSLLAGVESAEAGGPLHRRAGTVVPTATVENPANANAPSPMLGTFYPTNFVMVGGGRPTGSGFSPLGLYAGANMVQYGPFSIYRATTAPISVYSRGYDGRVYESPAHSFSTPFRPASSPVVKP